MRDRAGYARGGDGIRITPADTRMHIVFQTSINSPRQKEQDIVKDGWQEIGIEDRAEVGGTPACIPATLPIRTHRVTFRPTPRCSRLRRTRLSGYILSASTVRIRVRTGRHWSQRPVSSEFSQMERRSVRQDRRRQLGNGSYRSGSDLASAERPGGQCLCGSALIDRKGVDAKVKGLHRPNPTPFTRFRGTSPIGPRADRRRARYTTIGEADVVLAQERVSV